MKKQTLLLLALFHVWAIAAQTQFITLQGNIIDSVSQNGITFIKIFQD